MSAAVQVPLEPALMTVEEFLAWDPQDGQRWQLVNGKPWPMTGTSRTHSLLLAHLARLLGNHLDVRRPGWTVLSGSEVVPGMLASINARIPDLVVMSTGYSEEQRILPDPVLLIEILSPSNDDLTWNNALSYGTIPSVAEVLVLQSEAVGAYVLRREPDGSWPKQPIRVTEGDLGLDSIGFSASLREIYRTTRFADAVDAT